MRRRLILILISFVVMGTLSFFIGRSLYKQYMVRHITTLNGPYPSMALSPDHRLLAVADETDLFLYDTTTFERTPVITLAGTGSLGWVTWSRDGQYLLWDVYTGMSPGQQSTFVYSMAEHRVAFEHVGIFSLQSDLGSDNASLLSIWNDRRGIRFMLRPAGVESTSLPDNCEVRLFDSLHQRFYCSDDKVNLMQYSFQVDQPPTTFPNAPVDGTYSPDGNWLVGSVRRNPDSGSERSVVLLDLRTGERKTVADGDFAEAVWRGNQAAVSWRDPAVQFFLDRLAILDATTGKLRALEDPELSHLNLAPSIAALHWSEDGHVLWAIDQYYWLISRRYRLVRIDLRSGKVSTRPLPDPEMVVWDEKGHWLYVVEHNNPSQLSAVPLN